MQPNLPVNNFNIHETQPMDNSNSHELPRISMGYKKNKIKYIYIYIYILSFVKYNLYSEIRYQKLNISKL